MPRLLIVASLVLLLSTFTGSALAQPPVCAFYGYATIDGDEVNNGTIIKAWIDGTVVYQVTTPCQLTGYDYDYYMSITDDSNDYEGKTINFTIGTDNKQAGSATWISGEHFALDLKADSTANSTPASLPNPSITLYPPEGIATQISGKGFTPGSSVSITVGGQSVGSVIAQTDSSFSIVVAAPAQNPGTCIVSARDTAGRSDQAILTVPDISGKQGHQGDRGAPGAQGEPGPKGSSGGGGMALAALVLSIIAIIGIILIAFRISTYWKRH